LCRSGFGGYDYRRAAFGEAWDDDNAAPGGHNGCDTRNDILGRDLVDKTYVSIKRCPDAVETGVLHDPYTNETISFMRDATNVMASSQEVSRHVPSPRRSRGAVSLSAARAYWWAKRPFTHVCPTLDGPFAAGSMETT